MKLKSLLILLVLTFGMGLYIYYGVEKAGEKKHAQEDLSSKLNTSNLSLAQYFKLQIGDKKINLDRQTVGWRLTEPVKDLVSQSKIENLIAALDRMKKSKTLLESSVGANLAQYGLLTPKVRLEWKTSDQAQPQVILLGGNNPGNSGTYVLIGDKGPVVLATMDLDFLSTQSAEDFREMRFTTVSSNDYTELQIDYHGQSVRLKRNAADQWEMTSPYQAPVDADFVRGQADKISYIRANQFIADTPKVLEHPDIHILVGFKPDAKDLRTTESDQRPHGTEIVMTRIAKKPQKDAKKDDKKNADPNDNFDYYGKSDKTQAALIPRFHYENFAKPAEDYVKRTFDQFLSADVQSIQVNEAGKGSFSLIRKEKDWSAEKATNKKSLSNTKVDEVIGQLRTLHAVKFLGMNDKASPKPKELTVTLSLKDGKQLSFGFEFQKDASLLSFAQIGAGPKSDLRYALPASPLKRELFKFDELTKEPTQPTIPVKKSTAVPSGDKNK